jgi:hypothetical protein
MYHPPDIIQGPNQIDDTVREFIELSNLSSASVPLYDPLFPANTWRLRNGVDFDFPAGLVVPPGGQVLVVGFDPAADTNALIEFQTSYHVPAGVPVLGPYDGRLANGREQIDLYKPDPPQAPPDPDAGFVPFIWVERIQYSDTAPWPISADGVGDSLQRHPPSDFGNDPVSWLAAAPTAGHAGGQLRIDAVLMPDGGPVILRFNALASRSYRVESRTSLATGSWSTLTTMPAPSISGPVEISDTQAAGQTSRYYRVVAE